MVATAAPQIRHSMTFYAEAVLPAHDLRYLDGIGPSIVLVHITPEKGPAMLMIVEAGQLGRHGANTAGIALHANGLSSRLRYPPGFPSPLWRRQILREGDIVDALSSSPQ